jgi:hypothetical protein
MLQFQYRCSNFQKVEHLFKHSQFSAHDSQFVVPAASLAEDAAHTER